MPLLRPFPWGALDATTRREVAALASLRRALELHVDEAALAREMTTLAGVPVSVRLRRVEVAAPSVTRIGATEGVAVLFADAEAPERRFAIEAEGALAATLVAGALKHGRPRAIDPSRPVHPKLAGAFAAVVAACIRRAHGARPLRVLAAGGSLAVLPQLAGGQGQAGEQEELHVVALSVLVGDEAFIAKVGVAAELAQRAPERAWDSRALESLGDVTLALPVVACASLAARAAVDALAPGDAWLPGAWPLGRDLAGPVLLAAPRADRGVRCDLGKDGRLVLRGGAEDLSMTDAALVENVGELPVVVRVEIGTAELRAREWANLRAGDVVALGRRVAEPVTLRVGSVEVARGELVEIEGEVGVRILSRAGY